MPEFYLNIDKPIDAQLREIKQLPAGTVIRFDDSIATFEEQKTQVLELINKILPNLKAGHVFAIDHNLTPELADLIGAKLAKDTIMKVVYPLRPDIAIAAVRHLGETHTLWFSVEQKEHIAAMKKLSPKPIAKIVAATKPGLMLQLPPYLSLEASLAAVKMLPEKGVLKLPADIEFETAVQLIETLRPGQKVNFSSAIPLGMSKKLAAHIPKGCGLEISTTTKNARALIAQLKKECFVTFGYFLSQKKQSEFSLTDPGLAEKLQELEELSPRKPPSHFWQEKPEDAVNFNATTSLSYNTFMGK